MKHKVLHALMNWFEVTQSTSNYEGVSWNEKRNLWQAEIYFNGKKRRSYINNEFEAVKTFNTHCDTTGILSQNPEICEVQNQKATNTQSKSSLVTLFRFVIIRMSHGITVKTYRKKHFIIYNKSHEK